MGRSLPEREKEEASGGRSEWWESQGASKLVSSFVGVSFWRLRVIVGYYTANLVRHFGALV